MFNKSVCHRIRAHLDLLPKCRCKLMHSKLSDKQNDDELVIFSFKRSVFRFMDACNKRSQKWGWVNNGGPLLTRYQLYYGDLMWLVDFNSFCSGSLMWMASLILLVTSVSLDQKTLLRSKASGGIGTSWTYTLSCSFILSCIGLPVSPQRSRAQIPYEPKSFSGLIFTTTSLVFVTAKIASIFVLQMQFTYMIFIYLQWSKDYWSRLTLVHQKNQGSYPYKTSPW